MKLSLNGFVIRRESLALEADAEFCEGMHVIQGPVGSGKSSLALAMAGRYPIAGGSLKKEGICSCTLSLQFPEYHVTTFSLGEECRSWGLDPQPILTSLGFNERAGCNPLSLSRGELKRLILACALHRPADLLLLDEPFSALDCEQKEILCDQLANRTAGITMVFTHEREFLPATSHFWEIANGILMKCHFPLSKIQNRVAGQKLERGRG